MNKDTKKQAFESCSVHWTWAEGDVEEEMEKAKQRRWRGMQKILSVSFLIGQDWKQSKYYSKVKSQ